jgi:hypothetical protein
MNKKRLWLIVSVLVLSNCIVPQYINYDDVVRESKSEDYNVKIYTENELSDLNYMVIGEVIVSDHNDVNVLIGLMRKKVKEIGGDGIIELEVNGDIASAIIGGNGYVVGGSYTSFIVKGKVIVLIEE